MPFGSEEIAEIERRIGYVFKDKALLTACFTHASYAHRHGTADNERLEFLGDAVLGFLAAEALYRYTDKDEGYMTARRQQLVSEAPLRAAVERAGLAQYLRAEGSGGSGKAVSSLFEAIVAGLYLDGGMDAARAFVARDLLSQAPAAGHNHKGELQEWLQARGAAKAEYVLAGQSGSQHAPRFLVRAFAMGESAEGEGGSKAEAEKRAAAALLAKLRS